MPLVVELEQGRTVRVLFLQVKIVDLRLLRRVSAFLTDVDLQNGRFRYIEDEEKKSESDQIVEDSYLCSAFFVGVLMLDTVDFEAVTFERAPLGEALLAEVAFVGPDTRVRPRMPLQVEGVIESLAAECAKVPLHITVALHVAV